MRRDSEKRIENRTLTRRRAVGLLGLGAVGVLLAACGQAAQPTAAPTKPAEAPKPAAPAPTAVPATAPAATQPAASAKPGSLPPGVGFIKGPLEGEAKTLNGAGATFPAALYSKWHDEYFKLTQVKTNYQSIGSGGGIKSITDGTVDFGATDGPMTDEQLKAAKGEVLHIPMTLGGVAATYNLPELKDPLKLTGETLPA